MQCCYKTYPQPSYLVFRPSAFVNEKILTGLLWASGTDKLSFTEREDTIGLAGQAAAGSHKVTTWEVLKYHSLAGSRYFLNGQRKKPSHEFMEWNPAKILQHNLIWALLDKLFTRKEEADC